MNLKNLLDQIVEELKNAARGRTLVLLIEASGSCNISVSTLRSYGKYLIRLRDLAEFLISGMKYCLIYSQKRGIHLE